MPFATNLSFKPLPPVPLVGVVVGVVVVGVVAWVVVAVPGWYLARDKDISHSNLACYSLEVIIVDYDAGGSRVA